MAQFSVLLGRKEKISNSPILLKNMSDEEIYQSTRFPRFAVEKLCELVISVTWLATRCKHTKKLRGSYELV